MTSHRTLKQRFGNLASQSDDTLAAATERKTPRWLIALTFVGAITLLIVGLLVLIGGRELWKNPGYPQVSHPTKATFEVVKKPVKIVKRNGVTRRRFSAVKRVKTVERASEVNGRSEAVALATLATGAALLLAGGFAARLTKLKLPGVEMDTETLSAVSAAAGVRVAEAAKQEGRDDILGDPMKLAEATKITLRTGLEGEVGTVLASTTGAGPQRIFLRAIDEDLQQAAADAVKEIPREET